MRRVAILLAVMILVPGCFVFDELDKGREIMEKHSPKKPKEEATAPVRHQPPQPEDEGLLEQVQGWLAKRSTKAEAQRPQADPDDVPVSCRIGSRTQFLRKSDCQLRGGRQL